MLQWITRKLSQLAGWSQEAAEKTQQAEGKIAAFGWGAADTLTGVLIGILLCKLGVL